jgi:hypothetical protein
VNTTLQKTYFENQQILLCPFIIHQNILLAISFNGGTSSYEANEPLIIAAGDAEEEEGHRLEEKVFSRFKFSALLLGLLAGFSMQFSIVGAHLLVITLFGGDPATNSKIKFVVSLLWSFFTAATVAITYWTFRSKDLREEIVLHIRFSVGICLAWDTTGVILGMRTQPGYTLAILVLALVSSKIVVMYADSKLSSSRRSTAKQTMTADV